MCWIWKWIPASSRWQTERPAALPAPEKALPPPAGRPSAAAGRQSGRLDELNDTLELSGAKLKSGHAELPLYRAPSLDWALSGQNGLRFNRDDAFRRISRSFHAVKDSEYTPPESLHNVLRKYQRDGYRWLRTLDGYGMGGILADDMALARPCRCSATCWP